MQSNVTMNDFEEVVCPECGNDAYAKYFKIYKLSALKSPSGKEEHGYAPVYACANCGKIYNIQEEKSELEK